LNANHGRGRHFDPIKDYPRSKPVDQHRQTNVDEGIQLIQHNSGGFLAAAFADNGFLPAHWRD